MESTSKNSDVLAASNSNNNSKNNNTNSVTLSEVVKKSSKKSSKETLSTSTNATELSENELRQQRLKQLQESTKIDLELLKPARPKLSDSYGKQEVQKKILERLSSALKSSKTSFAKVQGSAELGISPDSGNPEGFSVKVDQKVKLADLLYRKDKDEILGGRTLFIQPVGTKLKTDDSLVKTLGGRLKSNKNVYDMSVAFEQSYHEEKKATLLKSTPDNPMCFLSPYRSFIGVYKFFESELWMVEEEVPIPSDSYEELQSSSGSSSSINVTRPPQEYFAIVVQTGYYWAEELKREVFENGMTLADALAQDSIYYKHLKLSDSNRQRLAQLVADAIFDYSKCSLKKTEERPSDQPFVESAFMSSEFRPQISTPKIQKPYNTSYYNVVSKVENDSTLANFYYFCVDGMEKQYALLFSQGLNRDLKFYRNHDPRLPIDFIDPSIAAENGQFSNLGGSRNGSLSSPSTTSNSSTVGIRPLPLNTELIYNPTYGQADGTRMEGRVSWGSLSPNGYADPISAYDPFLQTNTPFITWLVGRGLNYQKTIKAVDFNLLKLYSSTPLYVSSQTSLNGDYPSLFFWMNTPIYQQPPEAFCLPLGHPYWTNYHNALVAKFGSTAKITFPEIILGQKPLIDCIILNKGALYQIIKASDQCKFLLLELK